MTDTRRHNTVERLATAGPAGRRAFTLIEVLVVIFILGILAAIVVSIAGYVMNSATRRETEATQKVLMEAVQAFYDAGTPKAYPDPSAAGFSIESGQALVNILTGHSNPNDPNTAPTAQTAPVKAATELLLKLPREAWDGGQNPVVDGWKISMRYEATGGLGGKPVIISAGPDRRFGTNDPGQPNDATKEEDNIRSDESQ